MFHRLGGGESGGVVQRLAHGSVFYGVAIQGGSRSMPLCALANRSPRVASHQITTLIGDTFLPTCPQLPRR